jgi:hypothetical protein
VTQKRVLYGDYRAPVLIGSVLVLYYLTMQIYIERGSLPQPHYMILSTVQLFLVAIFVATQGEEIWIVHADYPGGSFAYFAAHVSNWNFGSLVSTVRQLMSDM